MPTASALTQFPLPFARPQKAARPGFLSGLLGSLFSAARIDRVIDARQRIAEAKVARFLERQGADRLTDSLERDISRLL